MPRNKKRDSGALRLAPAVKAFVLCLLLGGSGVGYVLQKNKIYELGRQIKVREVQLEKLTWENKVSASQLANLQLPQKISERVKAFKLGLALPQPGQIVWLQEPQPRPGTNAEPSLLVLREGRRNASH